MSVLNEALQFLGLAGGVARNRGPAPCASRPRQEQRELAEAMRALPGRFADRLSASALERITGAAAGGRWEEAVEELITALHARAEAVTDQERDELHAACEAMNMDGERVDGLLQRSHLAPSGSLSRRTSPAEADPKHEDRQRAIERLTVDE
jgi:hypothetical protein